MPNLFIYIRPIEYTNKCKLDTTKKLFKKSKMEISKFKTNAFIHVVHLSNYPLTTYNKITRNSKI